MSNDKKDMHIDNIGRVVLSDEDLKKIETVYEPSAGGTMTNATCNGSTNSDCKNGSCIGTTNTGCRNATEICSGDNYYYCDGRRMPPPPSEEK